jgi:16S rRNA (guanine527-N7)-methyltransferase
LLELAAPWFGPGVRGLFLKGRDAGKEIESAKRRFNFTCHLHQSMTAEDSFILEISHLAKRAKAKTR